MDEMMQYYFLQYSVFNITDQYTKAAISQLYMLNEGVQKKQIVGGGSCSNQTEVLFSFYIRAPVWCFENPIKTNIIEKRNTSFFSPSPSQQGTRFEKTR